MTARLERRLRWVASRVVKRVRGIAAKLVKADAVDAQLATLPRTIASANLGGRVAVVTGSSRGIGRAVATAFAAAGAKVIVNGRSSAELEQVVRAIRAAGGAAEAIAADVSTDAGARALIEGALGAFGRVDLLVNNAGAPGPHGRKAWELTAAEWEQVLDVNLTGAFLCSRLAADWMMKHGVAGRIINVSSGAARAPAAGLLPYCVSKSALETLTRALAVDLGRGGITVTALELGSVATGMTRPHLAWEDFQLLPPPETVLPLFLHAATAPGDAIHGRVLAAWRFARDPEAETALAGPLALLERASFPPLTRNGRAVERGDPGVVVLDRAENALGMPPKVRELLERAGTAFDLSRYPDGNYTALRAALGRQLGLPEECFTFGPGAAELVERTVRTFAQPGDEVIANQPTWFMFPRFCAQQGVTPRLVPARRRSDGTFDHDLEGIARAVTVDTRLVYLVSPSNPLGNGIATEDFLRFLDLVPPHLPVVVDEAYREFSSREETLSANQVVLRTDRRVIGLRTFSKFYSLAGLRVGYAYAAPGTLRLFSRLEQPFCLSSIAAAAAVAALEDEAHAARTREILERERRRIQERLTRAGLDYVPSETHFILVEPPAPEEQVYAAFESRDIFVPRGLVLGRYLFFPIAGAEQNERNLEILCSL